MCSTPYLEGTLEHIWPTLQAKTPKMVALFFQLLQNQVVIDIVVGYLNTISNRDRLFHKNLESINVDDNNSSQICLLASLVMRGFARNNSAFLRKVLGLYMLANGTPRRVIDTFSMMGIISSYTVLNELLNDMAEQAKDNLKKAAHDPNGVVVYDNFNLKSNVRELVGGKKASMINLTTASLVGCPELNGPLMPSSLDHLTQPFTREMVVKYLLPRRKTFDKASK